MYLMSILITVSLALIAVLLLPIIKGTSDTKTTIFIGILMFIGIIIGCGCSLIGGYYADRAQQREHDLDILEAARQRHINDYLQSNKLPDEALVEVQVKVADGIAVRVAEMKLKGDDFTKEELSNADKAINNVVINLLQQRKNELAKVYKVIDGVTCKIKYDNDKKIITCPNDEDK